MFDEVGGVADGFSAKEQFCPGVNCVESETWDFGDVDVAIKGIQAK